MVKKKGNDKKGRSKIIRSRAASFPVRGTDIYEGIKNVDWAKLAKAVHFCIARAQYGVKPDAKYVAFRKEAETVGLRFGAYGFILPDQNIDEQVNVGWGQVTASGGRKQGDLPFTADVEGKRWQSVPRGIPHNQLQNRRIARWLAAEPNATKRMDMLLRYLDGIEAKQGRKPMLYASAHFLRPVFPDLKPLEDYDLYWVAHYNVDEPDVQEPFATKNPPWVLWQADEKAVIQGIEGGRPKADLDYFYGSLEDFDRLFGPAV